MKNSFLVLLVFSFFAVCGFTCKKASTNKGCYKGRLAVKGICMNYTIEVLQGNIDPTMVVANWKDEATGKVYQNAVGLHNPCNFPASLKEGDEFYFTLNTPAEQDCVVCQAFYPTPPKKLSITVNDGPCN